MKIVRINARSLLTRSVITSFYCTILQVARHVERKWYQSPFASLSPANSCNHRVAPCVFVVMLLALTCLYASSLQLPPPLSAVNHHAHKAWCIISSYHDIFRNPTNLMEPRTRLWHKMTLDWLTMAILLSLIVLLVRKNDANGPSTGELAGIYNTGPSSAARVLNAIPEHGTSFFRLPNERMKLVKFKGDVALEYASVSLSIWSCILTCRRACQAPCLNMVWTNVHSNPCLLRSRVASRPVQFRLSFFRNACL
jgi:hypothetical protein